MSVTVQLVNVPEGRETEVYGPYDFVQMTYGDLRVLEHGDDETLFLAHMRKGRWVMNNNSEKEFTDVVINAAEVRT
jgi:hypothetical protein